MTACGHPWCERHELKQCAFESDLEAGLKRLPAAEAGGGIKVRRYDGIKIWQLEPGRRVNGRFEPPPGFRAVCQETGHGILTCRDDVKRVERANPGVRWSWEH